MIAIVATNYIDKGMLFKSDDEILYAGNFTQKIRDSSVGRKENHIICILSKDLKLTLPNLSYFLKVRIEMSFSISQ